MKFDGRMKGIKKQAGSSSGLFREAACNHKSIPDDSPESGRIEKFVDILFVREKV